MEFTRKGFIGFGGAFLAARGLNAGETVADGIDYRTRLPVFGEYDVCVVGAGEIRSQIIVWFGRRFVV